MSSAAPRLELDPSAMLIFGALAAHGSVRAAAVALGTPRSTVSRRVAELEAQVGVPLAVRTSRRFALTELGAELAERCRELDALMRRSQDVVRKSSKSPEGTLRVAAAPILGEEVLPELVAELLRRHAKLSVDVQLSVDYVDLRRGSVDVAVRAGELDDASDLFAVRLGVSTTGCWASPAYVKAHGLPKTPADLASHECIVVGGASSATWAFRAAGRDQRVRVSGRARTDSFRLARSLAVQGAGIVRTASIFAEPVARTGALVPVLERFWLATPLHAVHAGASPPSPKVRAFVDLVRQAMPQSLRAR